MTSILTLFRPERQQVPTVANPRPEDRRAAELLTAKAILSEVFSIRISEVEEMIAARRGPEGECRKYDEAEDVRWPQEFQLDGTDECQK